MEACYNLPLSIHCNLFWIGLSETTPLRFHVLCISFCPRALKKEGINLAGLGMGLLSLKEDGKGLEALKNGGAGKRREGRRVKQQCSYSLIMNSMAN